MTHAFFPSKARRLRAGFTLIELLIVVAMIGIMVAIVGPKFRLSESTEVQIAGMQLMQDLEVSRTRALATRSQVRFVFETGGAVGAYSGYLDENNDGVFAETNEERVALRGFGRRELPVRVEFGRGKAQPLPADANGSAITFDDERLWFSTRGITEPMGTSGVVYLTSSVDPAQATAVSVSGSGAIRLWVWRAEQWQ
jgi:prepilin-type N-terminal cleavage/methylation domain-containing protein